MNGLARLSLAALCLALVGGCQPPPADVELPVRSLSLANDYFIPKRSGLGKQTQGLTVGDGPKGEQLLFLNFGGATIKRTANPIDDAALNESWIPNTYSEGTSKAFPAFNEAPYTGYNSGGAQAAILSQVQDFYAPYNVLVSMTRPAAGLHYTMIMVGGTTSSFVTGSQTADAVGVAPLDCGNQEQTNVGFAFANNLAPQTTSFAEQQQSVLLIAQTAAHEAGHSFGLEHVNTTGDIMTPAVDPNVIGFINSAGALSDGSATCPGGSTTTENTNQRLLADPGPAPTGPTVAKPNVTFLAPKNGDTVPFDFTVAVSASQPAGAGGTITKVEIKQGGVLLGSPLTVAPYQKGVSAPGAGSYTFTAIAYNSLGGKAQVMSTFDVVDGTTQGPIGCLVPTDCMSTESCTGNACVPKTSACDPVCAANETCEAGICMPGTGGTDMATSGSDGGTSTTTIGASCTDSSTCGTGGVCASARGMQYCTAACDPGDATSCPSAYRCVAVGADHYCGPKSSSGCDVSGGWAARPSPAPLWALAIAAVVLRRRRGRASAT